MRFFRNKRDADISSMSESERASLIATLEEERDELNEKIEKTMRAISKQTGSRRAVRGAKKPGRSPKDYAYLEKKILKK